MRNALAVPVFIGVLALVVTGAAVLALVQVFTATAGGADPDSRGPLPSASASPTQTIIFGTPAPDPAGSGLPTTPTPGTGAATSDTAAAGYDAEEEAEDAGVMRKPAGTPFVLTLGEDTRGKLAAAARAAGVTQDLLISTSLYYGMVYGQRHQDDVYYAASDGGHIWSRQGGHAWRYLGLIPRSDCTQPVPRQLLRAWNFFPSPSSTSTPLPQNSCGG